MDEDEDEDEDDEPTRIVNTHAEDDFLSNETYSLDFRELVALCLAVDENDRPSLESVLEACEAKVMNPTMQNTTGRLNFNADV